MVGIAERTAEAEPEKAVLTRIRNAPAFLVEVRIGVVRDARDYELKALPTDLLRERAMAEGVGHLLARMGTDGPDSP